MAVTYVGNGIYLGLNADTKPTTGVATNAIFVTTNKPTIHYYNGSAWITDAASITTAQTFTAVQTFNAGVSDPLVLQRDTATPGSDVGMAFHEQNSIAEVIPYAGFRAGIASGGATDGSENGTIKFSVMVAGVLTPCLWIDGTDGQVRLGPNRFLRLSESGLSTNRTFTYPDLAGVVNTRERLVVQNVAGTAAFTPPEGYTTIFFNTDTSVLAIKNSSGTVSSV